MTSVNAKKVLDVLTRIRYIITDFDGVWTDGKVIFCQDGTESVVCSRKDTLRIPEIQKAGIKIIIISKEDNPVVKVRCKKMDVECFQGIDRKLILLKKILKRERASFSEVAFVGDDINDIECLSNAGFPITVADGHPLCKKIAIYVTAKKGGDHAMREIFDLILSRTT